MTVAATAWAGDTAHGPYGLGTTPTVAELAQFTSPLPDGRGMPAGSGSVAQGGVLYQAQCASCHGDKLQGGMGDRLIGGRGTLVNDNPTKAPVKTVESYWPYATTLFDYIKRAMPFTSPSSLSDDQVYALCAYILAEAKIVPPDTTLDASTLAAIRMPNRDGFIPDPRPNKFPPVAKSPHQELGLAAPLK
ncbi:MAG: c-type cytochrome [Casimicrobiaceae bacterium]